MTLFIPLDVVLEFSSLSPSAPKSFVIILYAHAVDLPLTLVSLSQSLAFSAEHISSVGHTLSYHVASLIIHCSSQSMPFILSLPLSYVTSINLEVVLPLAPIGNTRSMLTHFKIGNAKPKAFHVNASLLTTPKHFKEAIKIPEWYETMQHMYNAYIHNQTWVLVDPPFHAKIIRNLWSFKTKENHDGTPDKYNAC